MPHQVGGSQRLCSGLSAGRGPGEIGWEEIKGVNLFADRPGMG